MKSPEFVPEYAPDKDAGLFTSETSPDQADIIVIGVPWEPTVSYGRGTSNTPSRIVAASHQLDFFEPFLQRDLSKEVAMLPLNQSWLDANDRATHLAEPIIEAGGRISGELADNLAEINRLGRQINEELLALTRHWLKQGKIVAVLGGDHSSPLGCMKAYHERFPKLGVLHIDAHHDLRQAYEGFTYSHASIMYNWLTEADPAGPLVAVGIRDYAKFEREQATRDARITTFYDRDMKADLFRGESWSGICARIVEKLPEDVYVSFDIDGLDPRSCPHTGTPVPGGLAYDQAVFLLEAVASSGKNIVGFDLCEVSPNPQDPEDEWDLNVASRILHKLCALTIATRQG